MFKKSLLALALVGSAFTATAGTTTTSLTNGAPFAISNQGLPLTGDYTLATGADTIVTTFKAAELAALSDASNFIVYTIEGAYFKTHTAVATTGITSLVLDSADASTKNSPTKYYVDITTQATAIGDGKVTMPEFDLQVIPGSTEIKITSHLETTSGIVVTGTTSATAIVATVKDQWKPSVTKLDALIDVANKRETFTSKGTTDALTLKFTTQGTGANVNTIAVTVDGDFTGVDTVVGTSGAYTINSAKTQATRTITGTGNANISDEVITFTLLKDAKAVAQPEASFKVTGVVSYTANSATSNYTVLSSANAGLWELNSTSMTVNYAPFGPNTQLIINATSTFSETASVDLTYVDKAGATQTVTDVATVSPKGITKLGDIIAKAIMDKDLVTSGKTKMTVSVNAPDGTITFFTGFKDKVDGSRMALQMVDNNAANAATSSAANNTLLKDSSTGLAKLSTDIAANGTTNTNAAYLAAARSAVVTGATAGTITAEEKAQADAICNLGTTAGGYSQAAGVVADAAAITGTCI